MKRINWETATTFLSSNRQFIGAKHSLSFIILIFFIAPSCFYAQLDTTDFYPMKQGNYWEYGYKAPLAPYQQRFITVLGDTLLSNGQIYSIVKRVDAENANYNTYFYYQREINNRVYEYANDTSVIGNENLLFDFSVPLRTIWKDDSSEFGYIGYEKLKYDNNLIIPGTFETRVFNSTVYLSDNNGVIDTLWGKADGTMQYYLTKGIGITVFDLGFFDPVRLELKGAIINGKQYGIITDVKNNDQIKTQKMNFSLKAYPNPFNPTATISYSLPRESKVKLTIYNSLGQIVKVLVDETKSAGDYKTLFNAYDIPSGVYFYQLLAGNYAKTNKFIYIK